MRRKRRGRRGGYVLVLVALMAVGLFGLAALTIDLGMARATQVSMQAAADGAALEGLRGRDDLGWTDDALQVGGAAVDAGVRDAARRARVTDLVGATFDDDLDPSNGDALALGAGPVVGHDAGIGPLHASQLLTVDPDPALRVYDPVLEANAADEVHGDVVAGAWRGDDDPTLSHAEAADYARVDLVPRPAAEASADASVAAESSAALLVRLRRTPDLLGLDEEAGVSSRGPPLPFLFGLGTAIQQGGGAYDPREHGITVRATAIADARPAVVVGPAGAPGVEPRLGLAPLALLEGPWVARASDDPPASAWTLDVDAAGNLTEAGIVVGVAFVPAGPVRAGDAAPAAGTGGALRGEGFVPITRAGVVVGFGWVTIVAPAATVQPGAQVRLIKRVRRVAPGNASAVPHAGWPTTLPSTRLAADHALLAPALVR